MVKIAVLKCRKCGYTVEEKLPVLMEDRSCPKCSTGHMDWEYLELVDFKEKRR